MAGARKKTIRVMLTTFRDGLQSSFGGKVRLNDFLPAMKEAAAMGVRHIEFGGGARYQAPYFYLGEDPFEDMQAMRDAVGEGVDLQILTRSVSGVTLTTQSPEALELQARLMHRYGTTWDRNFDFMNDVENLVRTGKPIVDAGMHHQVCVAMMGLPFVSNEVHTPQFYVDIAKKLLDSDVHIDSICMKDASGTTDPKTIYETAKGIRALIPSEMPLWMHTHDTASTACACYQAAIEGGADGVDLSVRPMASGTVQPDVRSLAHVLKGTDYELDVDPAEMIRLEKMLTELMEEYQFNPTTTTPDARVLGFPMPGGAIGPNVHMMVKSGIIDRYGDVLAEFPVVVKAGGAWTSVTPGSQQYWLQAFNNVLYGRWEKIDAGYGRAVLGYFGKTPLRPEPEVVRKASEQLGLEPFDGNPLDAAPKNIEIARAALEERGVEPTEKNIFLVLAAMVPGKKMETNEGIRLLTGNPKIDIPLKKKQEAARAEPAKAAAPASAPAAVPSGPTQTRCTVEENGTKRVFTVTLEPVAAVAGSAAVATAPATAHKPEAANGTRVFSTFAGTVEVVDLPLKIGDRVDEGQPVAVVEAMKASHDIKSPVSGTITSVDVKIGDEIDASRPIVTVA
jgi:pyruvate carboxylase subunit B